MTARKDWSAFPCLGFDLETTGTSPTQDRIVTAALVAFRPGKRPHVTSYVTDPGIDIPDEAAAVHGYTREKAAAAQTHTPELLVWEVAMNLARWLGQGLPVVAFNAAFDLTMLEAECRRHDVDPLSARPTGVSPVIDPMVLANYAEPYRKKVCTCGCGAQDKTLAGWCAHYGVVNVGAHDSGGDALAACRLWPRIIAKHPTKFRGQTLAGLHQGQIGWRKAQADNLRAYFDREGIEHDGVDAGWPLYTTVRSLGVAS